MDGITLGIKIVKFFAGEAASIALQNLLPYKSLEEKVVQALGNALDKVARGNELWKKDVKIQESAVIDALIWMIDSPDAPIPTNLFDKKLLIQFKTELEEDANTWAYLQILLLNHRLKKSNEKNEKEIRRLDDKINELLQNINANIRFLTSVPAWADVDNVIGREDDLEKLWKELSERKRVLLTGLGGIGKTKLAQMLFHNYRDRFEEVAWIDYKEDLKHSFLACVNAVGFNKGPQNENERWETMKSSLLNDGKKKLFIIDNVDDDTDQRPENDKELRALTGWDNTTILLTSRLDGLSPYILHELKELGKDDCKVVFNHYYGYDSDSELVGKIVELANYHTLTIELLAKGARREDLESYYEKIKSGFETISRKIHTDYNDENENATIEEHLKMLFDLQPRSDTDKKVLNSFAVLPVNSECSLKEIEQWFGFKNEDLDEVIQDGWLSFDGNKQTYSMHPLIRTIIRFDFLEDGQGRKTIAPEGTTDKILEYFSEASFDIGDGYKSLQRRIDIAESVITAVAQNETKLVASVFLKIGNGYYYMGDYGKALEYLEKAKGIKESKLGKDHPETATTYNNIALVYKNMGDYDKALEYHEKAMEISESKLGKDHPDTATTYNNIALVYEAKGDYDKALEYYEKAKDVFESKLGKDHPNTANTYNNIALVYDAKGDYDKALKFYEKALEIRETKLGKDHPDTATTYNTIARVYYAKGDYDKALEYSRKALEIRETKLGKDHPNTATTYINIGELYRAKGDYVKALEFHEKALEIVRSKLGKDHPSTATTYNNIAGAYYAKGDYDKASEYFLKALRILLIKNKNHPNTTSCFMNLAICYKEANMEKDFGEWLKERLSEKE